MSTGNVRAFVESPVYQGENETIAYVATIPTSWGTAPLTSITCTLYEDPEGDDTDRSSTMLSGSSSASGQVITCKAVTGLTKELDYRLNVKFTTSEGNIHEPYLIIKAVR